MQLTLFSDYSLRLMMYVAMSNGRRVTIEEAANAYDISRAHLMKVAQFLVREGFLEATRGRTGGLTLSRSAEEISLGSLVQATETGFDLVECFGEGGRCKIGQVCRLRGVLGEAMQAFLQVLDRYTLADMVSRSEDFDFLKVA
jgi:Rrf2 family nitric oxide-sensitive transcriptional repressor